MDLVDTILTNDTDLGFNVGYNFDLVQGSYWHSATIEGYGFSGSGSYGPLVNLGGSMPVASVDVFSGTVGVDFNTESIYLIA